MTSTGSRTGSLREPVCFPPVTRQGVGTNTSWGFVDHGWRAASPVLDAVDASGPRLRQDARSTTRPSAVIFGLA
ncbi:MAG: hypothetical protein JWN68_2244 [Nocardioides sp.]|nr:hypothetical protein [Nocardioides sp.]